MNNDLISREALKECARVVFDKDLGRLRVVDVSDIDNAPTVAARPQGEWKTNLTTGDIFCSCCKEVRRDTRIKHINFCNSCGAKMKGGAK